MYVFPQFGPRDLFQKSNHLFLVDTILFLLVLSLTVAYVNSAAATTKASAGKATVKATTKAAAKATTKAAAPKVTTTAAKVTTHKKNGGVTSITAHNAHTFLLLVAGSSVLARFYHL